MATRRRKSVTFEDAIQEIENEPQRKVRSSSFVLTINTNQRYKTRDAIHSDLRVVFNETKKFFGDAPSIGRIVEIERAEDTFESSVGNVEAVGTLEYGERSGLHLHMVLTFNHCTDMRIDRPALKREMDALFAGVTPGTYNNIQYLRNPLANTKAYITKYVNGKRLRMGSDVAYCENPTANLKLHIASNIFDSFARVVAI